MYVTLTYFPKSIVCILEWNLAGYSEASCFLGLVNRFCDLGLTRSSEHDSKIDMLNNEMPLLHGQLWHTYNTYMVVCVLHGLYIII